MRNQFNLIKSDVVQDSFHPLKSLYLIIFDVNEKYWSNSFCWNHLCTEEDFWKFNLMNTTGKKNLRRRFRKLWESVDQQVNRWPWDLERANNNFGHFVTENWCWLAMSLLMEQSELKLNSFWVSFFHSKVVCYSTFHFWKDDDLRREARSGSWFEVRNAWWHCEFICWNMQSRYFLDISHSWQPKLVFFTSILSPLVSFELKTPQGVDVRD